MFHHDNSDLHNKVVTVFKNGDSTNSKTLQVSLQWSIEDFLKSASRRLEMPTAHIAYNSTGHEVNDCMMIEDNDILYLSCGEPFQSPPTGSKSTKSAKLDSGGDTSMPDSVGMYDVDKYLGSGAFGDIMLGIHRITGDQVALKFLKKSEIQCMGAATRVTTEIQCLSALSHRNIIKLHARLETLSHVVLAIDLMTGGDLHEYLTKRGDTCDKMALSEAEARKVFVQLLSGVNYIHQQRIVHRDLKLENILLKNDSLDEIKIVDFGVSEFMQGATITHSNGTLSYFAPEMFSQSSFAGPPLDVWALGVILFAMLCGHLPFDGSPDLSYKDRLPDSQVSKNIRACEYDPAETLSDGAIDIMESIFQVDPAKRANISMLQSDNWMREDVMVWTEDGLVQADLSPTSRRSERTRRRADTDSGSSLDAAGGGAGADEKSGSTDGERSDKNGNSSVKLENNPARLTRDELSKSFHGGTSSSSGRQRGDEISKSLHAGAYGAESRRERANSRKPSYMEGLPDSCLAKTGTSPDGGSSGGSYIEKAMKMAAELAGGFRSNKGPNMAALDRSIRAASERARKLDNDLDGSRRGSVRVPDMDSSRRGASVRISDLDGSRRGSSMRVGGAVKNGSNDDLSRMGNEPDRFGQLYETSKGRSGKAPVEELSMSRRKSNGLDSSRHGRGGQDELSRSIRKASVDNGLGNTSASAGGGAELNRSIRRRDSSLSNTAGLRDTLEESLHDKERPSPSPSSSGAPSLSNSMSRGSTATGCARGRSIMIGATASTSTGTGPRSSTEGLVDELEKSLHSDKSGRNIATRSSRGDSIASVGSSTTTPQAMTRNVSYNAFGGGSVDSLEQMIQPKSGGSPSSAGGGSGRGISIPNDIDDEDDGDSEYVTSFGFKSRLSKSEKSPTATSTSLYSSSAKLSTSRNKLT